MTQATESREGKSATELTSDDHAILDRVEHYLAAGLALKGWWESEGLTGHLERKFKLTRALNRPSDGQAFFAQAQIEGKNTPLMGNFQRLIFDRRKENADMKTGTTWLQQQLREFVLRYFIRAISFMPAETSVADNRRRAPAWLQGTSLCRRPDIVPEAFGFSQVYFKTVAGEIGKFEDRAAIVDLREIGSKYRWIVLNAQGLNLTLKTRVPITAGPELRLSLEEDIYLVIGPEFVLDRDSPAPGIAGRYGIGYAFIKNPKPSFLAYGPGEFDGAIELIEFHLTDTGDIEAQIAFVAHRPQRVSYMPFDPIDWSFRAMNILSMGMASLLLGTLRGALEKLPLRFGSFDPVYASMTLLNTLTGGQAAERLCLSKDALDELFLLQHFRERYEMIAGALLTWRLIDDWLKSAELPEWVVSKRGS